MLPSLAQSPDGPISLVTNEPHAAAPPVLPLWVGLTIIAAITLLALLAWALAARRAAIDQDPAEYAFRALARRLQLPTRHATLLRKLARQVHCAPVALLLSTHALQTAALCHERANPPKRDQATLKELQL